MNPTDALLVASGLRVTRARREVLRGVDLRVGRGEIVAVLGPNGAGKSTLLGALAGTLAPTHGTVTRHGRVAALMQTPGLASRSALANVELALAWWGVPRAHRRQRARDALERMNAGHLATRPAGALSGGERRRVHLARALAVGADVLLLDEPFDGLDVESHAQLRDDTVEAIRDADAAALVVLHDRADVWAAADRVVVLVDGAVHADGEPGRLRDAPPTAETARLFGYDGALRTGDGTLLTRSSQVRVDPAGPVHGTVRRVVATESGHRIRIETDEGTLWAVDLDGRTRPGDTVSVRVEAGVEFDAAGRRR
jgi:ABC-type sulfate/molybdate transport systems ATPase subunit